MNSQAKSSSGIIWQSWLIGALALLMVLVSWLLLLRQERRQVQTMMVSTVQLVESLITRDLENRISALGRLAQRWEQGGATLQADWEADATNYYIDLPGYQSIAWADSELTIRWIIPLVSDEAVYELELTGNPIALFAASRPYGSRQATLTPPIELVQGGRGFATYLPVFRDRQFDGLMIAVFRYEPWLNTVLTEGITLNYRIRASVDGQIIYSQIEDDDVSERWIEEKTFLSNGQSWTLQLLPQQRFIDLVHSDVARLVLIFGLILSALLARAVHLTVMRNKHFNIIQSTTTQLENLIKNIPGMAFRCLFRKDWPVEFVSDGCQELFGYSKSDFETKKISVADLIHPDDNNSIWQTVKEAVEESKPFVIEYRIKAHDGAEKWLWTRGRVVENNQDDIHLEGISLDITNLHDARAALDQSEAHERAIVDNMVEAVITIDKSGNIKSFNRAALRMFQYNLQEVIGSNVNMLMPEPYHASHDQYLANYDESRVARIIGVGREVQGLRKDGTVFPLYLSVSEITQAGQHCYVGLLRDLSEEHKAIQEARLQREQLAHVDRLNMLGEMGAGIAHEVNQPLTAIAMYAQTGTRILQEQTAKKVPNPQLQKLQDVFEKLSTQALRAGSIMERMQQLTRRRESETEVIDCNKLLLEIRNLAEAEAHIYNINIEMDLSSDLGVVRGDPVQLQQVMLNLIRNGMQAMAGIACQFGNVLVLRTENKGRSVKISVVDSGTGVSDERAKLLYKPFSSSKDTGMGMGLSISKSIVNAHGGELGFSNNVQAGATFYIILHYVSVEDS